MERGATACLEVGLLPHAGYIDPTSRCGKPCGTPGLPAGRRMLRRLALLAGQPALSMLDPEMAHALGLRALRLGLVPPCSGRDDTRLEVRAFGCLFPNPIGLAAGFDKDAIALAPLAGLGFGYVEAGTVTIRPQSGNPRPRLFRLRQHRAVINRMGFNNSGLELFKKRLADLGPRSCPIGVNLGINKENADPERDYPALVAAVTPYADYITLNVSSPNTPGLRDLQQGSRLRRILQAIAASAPVRPPLLIKLAPDLSFDDLEIVTEAAVDHAVSGLIIGNTTITRPAFLKGHNAKQAGGLSGAPLFERSTEMLARAHQLAAGRLILIGCGGIERGAHILAKIRAGASLIQLYTAFAYVGPALIPRLKLELLEELETHGFASVSAAIGTA